MMKILITGANGQLGFALCSELKKRDIEYIGTDIQLDGLVNNYYSADITTNQIQELIRKVQPTHIIHCAAWTRVDDAEDDDKKDLARKINEDGTKNIALVAKELGIPMMYISTDYVFNGEGTEPWQPDCKDYAPLSIYGLSKLGGELAVSKLDKFFIVRIAWVFGVHGNNFIKTMLTLANKGYKELRVVDDQIGTPTYTSHLSRLLVDMIQTEKYGYYHATNEGGYISWADFAEAIFEYANKNIKVNRVTTAEYGVSKAKRPFNSRLDKSKLVANGFKPLPDWRVAMKEYIDILMEDK